MIKTPKRAVVLAAGRGMRMMPLTARCPKPLLPVAGVPILERILLGLHGAGLGEAVIVLGYLGEMIEAYFGAGERVGMRLRYRRQDPPDGTAGALKYVEAECGDEPFVLHWGDILIDPANYPALLAGFTQAAEAPACVLGLNWMDDPASGAAVYRQQGRITAIVEKPAPGTSTTQWNNAGVLVLAPQVWQYVRQVQPSPRGEYEFTEVLHLMLHAGETLLPFELQGMWSDIGTPETLAQLEERVGESAARHG